MKSTSILLLLSLFFGLQFVCFSQDMEFFPKEYVTEDGTIYWNRKLPLYLSVSPYPNSQGHQLKSVNPAYSNPIYLDTEGVNYVRTRYAVDKETQKTVSPLQEVLMPIMADGEGPNSAIDFQNAPRHYKNDMNYYGANLSIQISSKDKLSGVEWLRYQLDNAGFNNFFNDLSVSTEGTHTIQYYGVDRVGNKETTQGKTFVVDLTAPSVTHNINGFADENVIAVSSKIYFTASDELAGVDKIYYRFDDEDYKIYNGTNTNFSYLNDGDHILEYYAVDHVKNQTQTFRYEFYFDKTAPLTASDILGDRFIVKDKVYFSGRTKMKLTAVDNKIGVKEIKYSIDNGTFENYDQPFYLPSIPGEHSIRYYSLDRLSNQPAGSEAYKHNISLIYLDLTGPKITFDIKGPSFKTAGVQYIGPATKIHMSGVDNESGLQYLTYSIDGAQAEQMYQEPITINSSGEHKLEFFGYDNVNNRNVSGTTVFVDATPPEIYENFSGRPIDYQEGLPLYPPYVTVFLAATDDIVGNDKIYYKINSGTEKLYTEPISKLTKNTTYKIDIRAIDKVGNQSNRTIEFKTSGN